MGIQEETNILS